MHTLHISKTKLCVNRYFLFKSGLSGIRYKILDALGLPGDDIISNRAKIKIMTDEEFEQIVRQTIQSLPKEFLSQLDNVEVVIEDTPPNPSLLGLYRGVPKTGRIGYFALPDKITIYKQPLLRISRSLMKQERIYEILFFMKLVTISAFRIKSYIKLKNNLKSKTGTLNFLN